MIPALRTSEDGLNDYVSLITGITFDPRTNITRQELAAETDIEWIIRHHGGHTGRAPQYVEIDYSMDLQQALALKKQLDDADISAPPEMREKYPDKYSIIAGIESGTYEKDLQNLERNKAAERQLAEARKQADAGVPVVPLTQPAPPVKTDKSVS